MLAILFLAAAVSATPVTKILPIYEDPTLLQLRHQLPVLQLQRSWCAGECYRRIVDRPVFAISKSGEGYDIHFSESGLNGLAKNPQNAGLLKNLNEESKVAIVGPVSSFPIDSFPGLEDAKFDVAGYQGKLGNLKEPSMMMILTKDQFRKFNEKKGYAKVADLGINQDTFSVVKEYSQLTRNVPVSTVNPSGEYFFPTSLRSDSLYNPEVIDYLPAPIQVTRSHNPYTIVHHHHIISNPIVLKTIQPVTL
ncbi:hypothetical protein J6590_023754 [Homalodisca vitripennis]|nr:hypothetical protein J6590_023754 [Homalodisca vitripennis]